MVSEIVQIFENTYFHLRYTRYTYTNEYYKNNELSYKLMEFGYKKCEIVLTITDEQLRYGDTFKGPGISEILYYVYLISDILNLI